MRAFAQKQNQSQQRLFSKPQTNNPHPRSSLNVTSPLAHDFSRIPIHAAVNNNERKSAASIVHEVLRSPGAALNEKTRAQMEPRFGYDFSNVRVHTNERAAQSARALNARAYTVGNNVVFGAGQHAPFSYRGQKLLAHELAHVVQQDGRQEVIARSPDDGMEGRMIPLGFPEDVLEDERQKKDAAIKQHEDEQRIVIDLMENARKLTPDPKAGLRDPDNLLHNAVEMFDSGRFRLTVLSPAHYSTDLHFDTRVQHPKVGGNYPVLPPKNPRAPGRALMYDTSTSGRFEPAPSASGSIGGIQTLPPKVEHVPGEPVPKDTPPPPATLSTAPPTFSPSSVGDIFLFTRNADVASQFRQIFVHESQHVADLSTQRVTTGSLDAKLEAYKSEFRGYWIQPTLARTSLLDPGGTRFVEPDGKADNSKEVTIASSKQCSVCPRNDPKGTGFVETKTDFKNPRQEEIFWYIITNYPDHGYDCCYVFNEDFHKEVNRFAVPESMNLIDSERLMELNLELQTLNKSMTKAEVGATSIVALLAQLEPLDWIFLSDRKLSKPFWDSLKAATPKFVVKGVEALLKKGSKKSVSEAEVKKALNVK